MEVRDVLDPDWLRSDRLPDPPPDAPPEMAEFRFLVGEWDCSVTVERPDGTVVDSRGRWVGYYTLGGYAFQDDWYSDRGYQGTTWRSYDPREKHWINLWLQSNTDRSPGFVNGSFYGTREGGEIRLLANGEDDRGRFTDRILFIDIEPDSFTWKMSRSYDGGETWLEDMTVTRARRIR